MIYLMTGYPGAGKSTVMVEHAIVRYASQGRRVVANFPIDFAPATIRRKSKLSAASCLVIPDRPTRADLDEIGIGGESEEKAGLLMIDEAGTWLNTRTWQGGDRDKIIDWLSQSRKRGWDIILVAQAAGMLDKQVRDAICEMVVKIRRLDRKRVLGMPLPRVHFAICRYGLEANAPVLERWVYRGEMAQKCFGSYRLFGADNAPYCVLPATHTKWREPKKPGMLSRLIKCAPRAPRPLKPKLPLVSLVQALPVEERMRHWHRLSAAGAFAAPLQALR